jgi:hypothetical protein
MSFIRSKEIPPGSGNWYDYEVETTRVDGHVKQKVIRYLGKSTKEHKERGVEDGNTRQGEKG